MYVRRVGAELGGGWGYAMFGLGANVLLLPLRRALLTSHLRRRAPRRAASSTRLTRRRQHLALRAIRHVRGAHALRDRILGIRALEDMLRREPNQRCILAIYIHARRRGTYV